MNMPGNQHPTSHLIQQLVGYDSAFWAAVHTRLQQQVDTAAKPLDPSAVDKAIRDALPALDAAERESLALELGDRKHASNPSVDRARHAVVRLRSRLEAIASEKGRLRRDDRLTIDRATLTCRRLDLVKGILAGPDADSDLAHQLVAAAVQATSEERLARSSAFWWWLGLFATSSLALLACAAWLVMTNAPIFNGSLGKGADRIVTILGFLVGVATFTLGIKYTIEVYRGPGRRDGAELSDSAISWRIATIAVLGALLWVVGTMISLPVSDHALRAGDNPSGSGASEVCLARMRDVGATNLTLDGSPVGPVTPRAEPVDAPAVTTQLTGGEAIELSFGPYRQATRLGMTSYSVSEGDQGVVLSGHFDALPLGTASGSGFYARALVVGHRQDGNVVRVFVCADPSMFVGNPTGKLTTVVSYNGADATIAPATMAVTLQARYLWGIVPLVWLVSVFSIWLVLEQWPRTFRSLWLTLIAVIAPTAIVFGNVLSNDGWTGKWRPLVTLLVALYSTAVAAAATVKAGTRPREGAPG
ncbi:MAG: hypothetical protein IPM45_02505 [Acidimicrobiales bacterium]|nr:hypothetical protein [Acidimicrobiales bacterium]